MKSSGRRRRKKGHAFLTTFPLRPQRTIRVRNPVGHLQRAGGTGTTSECPPAGMMVEKVKWGWHALWHRRAHNDTWVGGNHGRRGHTMSSTYSGHGLSAKERTRTKRGSDAGGVASSNSGGGS
eukprot:gene12344-biopygen10986